MISKEIQLVIGEKTCYNGENKINQGDSHL